MLRPFRSLRAFLLLSFLLVFGPGAAAQEPSDIRAFSAAESRVLQAYVAVYSRPPDPGGLRYWSERLDAEGGSLVSIMRAFGESAEFQNRFGHLEYEELIRIIYLRLFNREPEPEGASYYLAALEADAMDLANIAMRIFDGARSSDADAVTNKTTAAAYFVSTVEKNASEFPSDGEALAPLLRPVSGSGLSVAEAFASIDRLLESWGHSSALVGFSSAAELLDYLKSALQASAERTDAYPDYVFSLDDVAAAPAEGAESGVAFSTTTVQEQGVDEADSVKTDGSHLYIATRAGGPCCAELLPAGDPGTAAAAVRVMELLDPAAAREVARIPSDDLNSAVDGLYLLTQRGPGRPDLLVTVGGGTSASIWTDWLYPWHWPAGSVEVALFDVDNPEAPAFLASIELDGQLITTRRIDETLYVVTRYVPSPGGYVPYPGSEPEEQANAGLLEELSLEDLLPQYTLNPGGETGAMVNPARSFLPPSDPDRPEQPTLVSVTAINLADPGAPPLSTTIIGPSETVYVAQQAVYLATTRHDYLLPGDAIGIDVLPSHPHSTDVHKLALTASGPAYRGSGKVVGHLGWEPGKKPFRLGEHEGVLRIATSVGDDWNGTASTRLTLLRESPDNSAFTLEETAHLDNIGKQGERLYASRFIGDRAYLVTFRVTDPLYVFDLSDPGKILQLAEIEIEGYSDYLYPLKGNLLLGIGKYAIPDPTAGDFAGRGAWYQGLKLALFDVSGSGREVTSLVLGKRGTESDALYNHHAVSFLPSADPDSLRLALPVRLHDQDKPAPPEPWYHYPWKHTGLYLFDLGISPGGEFIDNSGRIIVADESSPGPVLYSYGRDRSVIVGANVHYVHGDQVWSSTWENPGEVDGPR